MSYSSVALLSLDQSIEQNFLTSNVYSDINSAVNSVPDDTLLLIGPGTYTTTARFTITKRLALAGINGRPIIKNADVYDNHFRIGGNADVVLDGITLQGPDTQPWVQVLFIENSNAIRVTANRTFFDVASSSQYSLGNNIYNPDPGILRFQHCTLERGYATIVYGNLSAIDLYRCYTPNYRAYITSETLNLDDKMLVETDGYGHESGVPLIDLNDHLVNISSRVVDLRPAPSPRVVLFDWLHPDRYCVPGQMAASGHWSDAFVGKGLDFGVYYLSRDARCPPIIHGPYTAE
jgi:hypothetical protein